MAFETSKGPQRPKPKHSKSSSPSLEGMELSVPPFQTFMRRTPPQDCQKPLPPAPKAHRRSTSTPTASTRQTPPMSTYNDARRSSSVYSRTVSQWAPDGSSWQNADFGDAGLLYLQPIAYNASTPQFSRSEWTPALLGIQSYKSVMPSPSSMLSRASTPPASEHRPSTLLPPVPTSLELSGPYLRTVSLEKAKEMMQSAHSPRLLPEERRKQASNKPGSYEWWQFVPETISPASSQTEIPETAVLVDGEGGKRVPPSGKNSYTKPPGIAFHNPAPCSGKDDGTSMAVGKNKPKVMATLTNQPREASKVKALQALGIGEIDEPRGRTRHRGPRQMDYSHYMPRSTATDSEAEEGEDHSASGAALNLVRKYHAVLTEQYRKPSVVAMADSDDEVKAHMKMVPQPLFTRKLRPNPPGHLKSMFDTDSSISMHKAKGSQSSLASTLGSAKAVSVQSNHSGSSGQPSSLSKQCLTPSSGHSRQSSSGSIPISPPNFAMSRTSEDSACVVPKQRRKSRFASSVSDNRVSAYYPHVMRRKKSRKDNTKIGGGSDMSGLAPPSPKPMLAADIIAERLQTPDSTPGSPILAPSPRTQPLAANPVSQIAENPSSIASLAKKDKQPLHRRLANGAAHYMEIVTKSPEVEQYSHRLSRPATTSAISASPQIAMWPGIDAEEPNNSFQHGSDNARAVGDSSSTAPRSPLSVVHTPAPPKPLDMRQAGLRAAEDSKQGRIGALVNALEFRKEAKAERRRQELKRMIRVVPEHEREGDGMI